MRNLKESLVRLIAQATAAKACIDAGLPFAHDLKSDATTLTIQLGDFSITDLCPAPEDHPALGTLFKDAPGWRQA